MSDKQNELTSKIKKNRQYLKEAQAAILEVRKTLKKGGMGSSKYSSQSQSVVSKSTEIEESAEGNLGKFVSTRNAKGWLKMRL